MPSTTPERQQYTPLQETGQLSSLQEAAKLWKVSEKTLRRRIQDGTLPAYKIGPRLIRVRNVDVSEILNRIPVADALSDASHDEA